MAESEKQKSGSLPTLFVAGNLLAGPGSPPQKELDTIVPLDYIMGLWDKRLPQSRDGATPGRTLQDLIWIIESSTGSGKSTVLPPDFYHRFYKRVPKNIACTQPRVLTSVEIPMTILPHNTKDKVPGTSEPLELGKNIGYQTGVVSKRPVRGIIYMTVGVLVQQLNVMSDEDFMRRYSVIFIDEAHERSINTDLALFMLKRFLVRNQKSSDCPLLVVMSATFDTKKFADYLLSDLPARDRYQNIIRVKGQTYPIKEHFLTYDASDYITAALDQLIAIHTAGIAAGDGVLVGGETPITAATAQQFRDILIFVAGVADIRKLRAGVEKLNREHKAFSAGGTGPVLPLELTSDIVKSQSHDYRQLFTDLDKLGVEVGGKRVKPSRRVILSTNVGETGITFMTVGYVINTGWFKCAEANPDYAVELLVTKPNTQGMHIQRRGRVGRLAPGVCYSLYTAETFAALQVDQWPDMLKDDVTRDVLTLLVQNMDPAGELHAVEGPALGEAQAKLRDTALDVFSIDLLDPPSADSWHTSLDKLYGLGAIDANSVPTLTGYLLNRFRFISLEGAKMILAGYAWNHSVPDLITVVAFATGSFSDLVPEEKLYDKAAFSLGPDDAAPPTGEKKIGGADRKRAALPVKKAPLRDEARRDGRYAEQYTELLLADDWLRYLTIWRQFVASVDQALPDHETVARWCEARGLDTTAFFAALELREEIVHNVAMIGLDPYHGHAASFHLLGEEREAYIARHKHCLWEGYKANLAVWDAKQRQYVSRRNHLPLPEVKPLVADAPPRYIVYDGMTLLPDPQSGAYRAVVSHTAVLDGFLPIDPNFDALL